MSAASKTAHRVLASIERVEQAPLAGSEIYEYGAPRRPDTPISGKYPIANARVSAPRQAEDLPVKTIQITRVSEEQNEPYLCPTTLTESGSDEPIEGTSQAIDLRAEGTQITLACPLPEGSRIVADLRMPNQLHLRVHGVVSRCVALGRALFRVEVVFEVSPVLLAENEEIPWLI
jgi:hypothetical protein